MSEPKWQCVANHHVSPACFLGLGGHQFSCGSFGDLLGVSIKVEKKKSGLVFVVVVCAKIVVCANRYARGIELLSNVLFGATVNAERLAIATGKVPI